MKAILEFDLPDEDEAYRQARNGAAYCSILSRLKEDLRSQLKYNPPKNRGGYTALQSVYESIFSLAQEYGVSFD